MPDTRTRTRAPLLAWGIASATILFVVGGAGLLIANGQLTLHTLGPALFVALTAPSVAILGALVAAKRPRNAVGWLMLAAAALLGAAGLAGQVAIRALQLGASTHGWAQWVAWFGGGGASRTSPTRSASRPSVGSARDRQPSASALIPLALTLAALVVRLRRPRGLERPS